MNPERTAKLEKVAVWTWALKSSAVDLRPCKLLHLTALSCYHSVLTTWNCEQVSPSIHLCHCIHSFMRHIDVAATTANE